MKNSQDILLYYDLLAVNENINLGHDYIGQEPFLKSLDRQRFLGHYVIPLEFRLMYFSVNKFVIIQACVSSGH